MILTNHISLNVDAYIASKSKPRKFDYAMETVSYGLSLELNTRTKFLRVGLCPSVWCICAYVCQILTEKGHWRQCNFEDI